MCICVCRIRAYTIKLRILRPSSVLRSMQHSLTSVDDINFFFSLSYNLCYVLLYCPCHKWSAPNSSETAGWIGCTLVDWNPENAREDASSAGCWRWSTHERPRWWIQSTKFLNGPDEWLSMLTGLTSWSSVPITHYLWVRKSQSQFCFRLSLPLKLPGEMSGSVQFFSVLLIAKIIDSDYLDPSCFAWKMLCPAPIKRSPFNIPWNLMAAPPILAGIKIFFF